jgi:hypothetical protein
VTARVGGTDRDHVFAVHFYAGQRRMVRDRRPPFAGLIPRKFLRTTSTVRAIAFLKDSRMVTLDRRVRACPPPR